MTTPDSNVALIAKHPRCDFASWLTIFALALFFCALSIEKIWAPDVWWQLRTGQTILDTHSIPTHDLLSYTAKSHDWLELRWLYCILLVLGWKLGGAAVLIIGQTVIGGLALTLIGRAVRERVSVFSICVILTLTIVAASGRFSVRPEMFTYLLTTIYLLLLDAHRRGTNSKAIWWLIPLQIVWTNLHPLFVLGPILAWVYAVDEIASRMTPGHHQSRKSSPLWAAALLVTLVCVINPYGVRGATFPWVLFGHFRDRNAFGREIQELFSPFSQPTWTLDLRTAGVLSIISAATFVWGWRRIVPARLVIWGLFLYLACSAIRNVALFSLIAGAISLLNLADITQPERDRTHAPRVSMCLLSLGLLMGSWYVITDRFYVDMPSQRRFGLGVLETSAPSMAASFIKSAAPQGQVFASLAEGSYLTWATPEYPVFIDGRLEVYGEDLFKKYGNAELRRWADFSNEWNINAVIIDQHTHGALLDNVLATRGWVLVHVDPRDAIFVRDIPAHRDLIAKYRIDGRRLYEPRGDVPDESVSSWQKLIGGVGTPWYSLSMGEMFVRLGSMDNAAQFFERGLKNYPDNPDLRLGLSVARRYQKRADEADRLMVNVQPNAGTVYWFQSRLAQMLIQDGRPREAIKALEAALLAAPEDPLLLWEMALCAQEVKEYQGELETFLRRSAAASRFRAGGNNLFLAARLIELGVHLADKGDSVGAEKAAREAVEIYRGMLQMAHPDLASALGLLGSTLLSQKKYEAAEPILAECLAIREKSLPAGHWQRFSAMSMMGEVQAGLSQKKQAETMLLNGYEGMQKNAQTPQSLTRAALERLIRFYDSTGQRDKAAEYRARLQPTTSQPGKRQS